MISEFISEYGMTILYAICTAIAGAVGLFVKRIYSDYVTDQTKEKVVKTCVKAIEQLYNDLDGEEKYTKAIECASEMLNAKNIPITALELEMLIESAVCEFKSSVKC